MANESNWLLLGFAGALSAFLASAFVLWFKYLQRDWSRQAEQFVKRDKKEVQRVIRDNTVRLKRLSETLNNLEMKADQLEYRLLILQDLTEVSALFADRAPAEPASFQQLIGNLVLAATQSLLPARRDTRARLLTLQGDDELVEFASYVPKGAKTFTGNTFKRGQGAVGTCFAKGQAVLVPDTWADPLFADRRKPRYRSVLCVPVPATAGQPIGVLNVDAPETDYFKEDHARLLAAVANIIYSMWRMQHHNIGNPAHIRYNHDGGRHSNGQDHVG